MGNAPTTPTSTIAGGEAAEHRVAGAELVLDAVEGLGQREPLALLEGDARGEDDEREHAVALRHRDGLSALPPRVGEP